MTNLRLDSHFLLTLQDNRRKFTLVKFEIRVNGNYRLHYLNELELT